MQTRKKVSVRITALFWADVMVGYSLLLVMQDYLTGVWNLSFTHAAGILNLWTGLCMAFQVVFGFLVDAFLGNFTMLVISSIAYSVGICLLTMSTPPAVFSSSTGMCERYESECTIGRTQELLFHTGMGLIGTGVNGNLISVRPFLKEQEEADDDNTEPNHDCLKLPFYVLVVIAPIVGAILLPCIKRWKLRFGIAASYTVISTVLFLSGCCWKPYKKAKPKGRSSITNACRDFVRMKPMWPTFLMWGIVSSIGNTFFMQQANNLNSHIGGLHVSLELTLFILKFIRNSVFSNLWSRFLRHSERRRRNAPYLVIGIAAVISVLCCATAALVERRRLNVVRSHDLLGKPNDSIPMSAYWLLFQFTLLSGLESFLQSSVDLFYDDEASPSRKNYLEYFTNLVSGLGTMLSAASVYVVGKISERGGKKDNWFQYTLNDSRLDLYYWVLAGLSVTNFIIYVVVALGYRYMRYRALDTRKDD